MATVATNAIAFLKTKDTVTAYVNQNIFETKAPQAKADPYIILRRTSRENADVLDGSVGAAPLNDGMQIDCVSTQEWVANAVADAVRTVLHLYRGAFGEATAKGCFVDSESLDFQPFGEGSDEGRFTRTLDTRLFL